MFLSEEKAFSCYNSSVQIFSSTELYNVIAVIKLRGELSVWVQKNTWLQRYNIISSHITQPKYNLAATLQEISVLAEKGAGQFLVLRKCKRDLVLNLPLWRDQINTFLDAHMDSPEVHN